MKYYLKIHLVLVFLLTIAALKAHAGNPLEKTFRELQANRQQLFDDKQYTQPQLYEANKLEFMKAYLRFMSEFRAAYAATPQQFAEKRKEEFVFKVVLFQQSLLETKSLVGEGVQAKVRYLFDPVDILTGLPWPKSSLGLFMNLLERRFGRDLNLSTYVTKPSEAALVLKYLEHWGSLPTDRLKRNIYDLSVRFIEVDTDDPATFNKVLDAIVHTSDGQGYWVWKYVLEGDQTFYRRQYSVCNTTYLATE